MRIHPGGLEQGLHTHARVAQCDIRVGRVMELRIPRVTPPRTNSRRREWP